MPSQLPPSGDQEQETEQETEREIITKLPDQSQAARAVEDVSKPAPELMAAPETKVSAKPSGMKLIDAKVTAGIDNARNIVLEKYWVNVDGHLPCGFNVKTLPNNGLEVTMQQQSYRRAYNGVGALRTQVCPNAPIGTPGKVVARDTTTGEVVEQPWVWHLIGGGGPGFFSRIINAIKNAIWPS